MYHFSTFILLEFFLRDQFFDSKERSRKKRMVDKPVQFAGLHGTRRGEQPVRQQHGYKMNESKILISTRLGFNCNS